MNLPYFTYKHIKLHFNSFSSLGKSKKKRNKNKKLKAINEIENFTQKRKILLKMYFVLCFLLLALGILVFLVCFVWKKHDSLRNHKIVSQFAVDSAQFMCEILVFISVNFFKIQFNSSVNTN